MRGIGYPWLVSKCLLESYRQFVLTVLETDFASCRLDLGVTPKAPASWKRVVCWRHDGQQIFTRMFGTLTRHSPRFAGIVKQYLRAVVVRRTVRQPRGPFTSATRPATGTPGLAPLRKYSDASCSTLLCDRVWIGVLGTERLKVSPALLTDLATVVFARWLVEGWIQVCWAHLQVVT